ncbi:hypothetical protein [Roseivirga sp.]|uniref:hypothetical protein n=1 Tax=Roseivirga sp. TaxID=1964215 RepID=UPI003B8CFB8A
MKTATYKLLLTITIFLLTETLCRAQSTQYVINRFSTPLMQKATAQSDTLKMIKPGLSLSIIPSTSKPDSVRYEANNMSLAGFWLKTTFKGATGYVFSADLSYNMPDVKPLKNNYELELYKVSILGQKLDSTEVTRKVQYNPETTVDFTENYFQYEYGKIVESWFDGCFYQEFHLDGNQLNLAFHLLRNRLNSYGINYETGAFVDTPRLIKSSTDEFQFEMSYGAADDIKIIYNVEEKVTEISFSSCT